MARPMKVLLVSLFHPELVRGGAQQICYELFQGLREMDDVEEDLAEPHPERSSASERKAKGFAHRAPAARANSQALLASGRTSGPIANACSFAAVPSRARPTMPWKIAARRKKLYAR